jgi:hypothetical protein
MKTSDLTFYEENTTLQEAIQVEHEKTEALIDGYKAGRIPFKADEYKELKIHEVTLAMQLAAMNADEGKEDFAPEQAFDSANGLAY